MCNIFVDFLSFRCSYYLLYQSFVPTTIHVILERYTIPKSFETQLLKQFNWRTVNQSLLNYLLIELRKSKDEAMFWETLRLMIEEPQLRRLVEIYALPKRSMNMYNIMYNVCNVYVIYMHYTYVCTM